MAYGKFVSGAWKEEKWAKIWSVMGELCDMGTALDIFLFSKEAVGHDDL